jgi:putative ABC transport system permease protein
VAIATLALATGAAMICFSLLDAIAFKPLPVDKPEQLVALSTVSPSGQAVGLPPRLLGALDRSDPPPQHRLRVCGRGATRGIPVTVQDERIETVLEMVSGTYFDLLHIHPLIGRLLESTDDRATPASTGRVAVLSENFWRARFAGDAHAIGGTLVIGGLYAYSWSSMRYRRIEVISRCASSDAGCAHTQTDARQLAG